MIETPERTSDTSGAAALPARPTPAAARWLAALLLAAALALATALCLTAQPSWDLWWQMKTGELILKSGHVPTTDPFSFTAPDHPWIAQEWSVAALFFLLYHHLGPFSLVLFKLLAAATACGLLMARSLRRGGDATLTAALVLLAAVATRWHMDIRPQLVSFVLLGALLWILEGRRGWGRLSACQEPEEDEHKVHETPTGRLTACPTRDAWLRWAPAAIMLLWVNSHAAFVLGLVVVGAYTVEAWWEGERGMGWVKQWGLPGVAALGATLVNPYSYHALLYPSVWLSANLGPMGTGAWASPDFHSRPAQGLEIVLMVWLCAAGFSRKRLRGCELVLLLALALAALVSGPLAPYFVFASVPWLAGLFGRVRGRETLRSVAILAIVLAALVLVAFRAPRGDWFAALAQTGKLPAAACDRIRDEGWSEGMMAERDWGGYCAWRFFPQRVVFAETRLEIYPSDVADDFNACMNAYPDTEQRLWRRGIRTLLLRRDSIAARFTEHSPLWRCVYSDRLAMVFRRRESHRRGS